MNIVYLAIGAVGAWLLRLYGHLFYTLRLDSDVFERFYKALRDRRHWKFSSQEHFVTNDMEVPSVESSWVWYHLPFSMSVTERLLTTGWEAKETVANLTTFFFLKGGLNQLVRDLSHYEPPADEVFVHINLGYGFTSANKLSRLRYCKENIFLKPDKMAEIFAACNQFYKGERNKLGVLLYGDPGNGKSSVARMLACHYGYNVYAVVLKPDLTNQDIIRLFLDLPQDQKILVLLEDFDGVFNGRTPLFQECKFSFDVFLNLLDGVYVNVDSVLFCMTANDITKVDPALKHRPSRFDVVTHVACPDHEERVAILCKFYCRPMAEKIARLTDNESVAVLCEIGKRGLRDNPCMEHEVGRIVESFK